MMGLPRLTIQPFRPARLVVQLLLAWMLFAFVVTLTRAVESEDSGWSALLLSGWWLAGAALLAISLLDWFRGSDFSQLDVRREVASSLFLGATATVKIYITNQTGRQQQIQLFDHYPAQLQTRAMPGLLEVKPAAQASFQYLLKPVQRGDGVFGKIQLRLHSRWRLWEFDHYAGEQQTVRIFPNFSNIAQIAALGLEHRAGQMGIHLQQRRGEGQDFRQLREFREGDALKQIDWKASARQRKPISREYQDERDQEIVFLLDCGRRMRAKDDELSHFDHALNAVLVTAYVALRQGDAVGLGAFAAQERWIAPVKGQHSIQSLMNQVYDIHSSTETTDLVQLASKAMTRYRKRSLVVLVSNLREEDRADLLLAARLLTRRHILVVASLREDFIDKTLATPPEGLQNSINYAATHSFNAARMELVRHLGANNVIFVEDVPARLHVAMVNEYMALKRRGAI